MEGHGPGRDDGTPDPRFEPSPGDGEARARASSRSRRSTGGLATGLRGPHEQSGGLWIGWPGDVARMTDAAAPEARRAARGAALRAGLPVERRDRPLLRRVLERRSLAALSLPARSHSAALAGVGGVPRGQREVRGRRRARVAARRSRLDSRLPADARAPRCSARGFPARRIGFFLHIPFPASEVFRILPWREQILDGMLGADLLGFHTFTYRSHFASSVLRVLGLSTPGERIFVDGREIRLGVFPIGVDAQAFSALADDPEVLAEARSIREDARGERILLGIDRLDYTKGIPRRLLAFERLLETEPRCAARSGSIQVAVPSRDKVPSYQEFRAPGERARGAHQRRVLDRRLGAHPLRAPLAHREARRRALPRGGRDARDAAARRHEPRREGVRRRRAPTRTACSC